MVFCKKTFKFYSKIIPASSTVLFLYLTNISFFHWPSGNPERDIASFRNNAILLVNVKFHCLTWEVPASGPRQPGWLKQVQETVSEDYQALGVITPLISLGTPSFSAHRLLTNPSKAFVSASVSLYQSLPLSPPPLPHMCASSLAHCFCVVVVHPH